MASPTVSARTETAVTTAGTSHTINFVATTGELVVIFWGLDDTARAVSTLGDGFTNVSNISATFHVFAKTLNGTEGSDVVVTWGGSTKGAGIAYNIAGQEPSITPEQVVATGTDTAPNPPLLTPATPGGSRDYLWLAGFRQAGEEADDDTWCTAAPATPSAFTNLVQKTTDVAGATTANGSVASAQLASTASSMNPGTFTVAQSLLWRAITVGVYPRIINTIPTLVMAPQAPR